MEILSRVAEKRGRWESKKGKDIEKAVNDWYSTWEYRDSFNSVKPR